MEPRETNKIFAAVNEVVELDVNGLASLAISLRGTFSGTFTFKGTIDGKTWFNLDATPIPTGTVVASATAVGQWQANVAGLLAVQVKCTVFTSGSPEVVLRAIPSGGSSGSSSGGGGGAATIADGADVTQGAIADASVSAGATGTLSAKLRRISADIGSFLTGQSTGNTSLGNIDTNAGATSDAAVAAGATGSISAKFRRLTTDIGAILTKLVTTGIQQFDNFGTSTAFTITLASLASSAAGVGRQSNMVDNTTTKYESALIHAKITVGTTPTINTLLYIYLLRDDGTIADDAAGASDAALTVKNAPLLGTILIPATTSDTAYYGVFDTKFLGSLGKKFGIAVVNSSGVALNSTGGNHAIQYTGINKTQI